MTKPRFLAFLLTLPLAACGAVSDIPGDDAPGDDTIPGDDVANPPDAALPPPPDAPPPPPECTSDSECSGTEPVCGDDQTCHGCTLDAECASGACNFDSGACYAESEILYVAPLGTGPCTRAMPCGWLQDAVPRVTPAKHVILLAPAGYTSKVILSAANAPFEVHGAGVQLGWTGPSSGGSGAYPNAAVHVTGNVTVRFHGVRFLAVTTGAGTPNVALSCDGGSVDLDRVQLVGNDTASGGAWINYPCVLTGRRVDIQAAGIGLYAAASDISLDRSRVIGSGGAGLHLMGAAFRITNTVIARNNGIGIIADSLNLLPGGAQYLAFNTFVENGSTVVNDGTDLQCRNGTSVIVRNNLVKSSRPYTWLGSSGGTRPIGGECTAAMHYTLLDQPGYPAPAGDNVVGPSDLTSSTSGLPIDAHLMPTSLAIDAADPADTTMTTDLDGGSRPIGGRSDVGADEYQP